MVAMVMVATEAVVRALMEAAWERVAMADADGRNSPKPVRLL